MSERGLRIGPADFAFGLCESLDLGDLQPFRDETWDHCRPLPPIFGEGSLRSLAPIDGLSLIVARHGPCDEKVSVNAESPGLLKLMYLVESSPTRGRLGGEEAWFPASQGDLFMLSPSARLEHEDGPSPVLDVSLLVEPRIAEDILEKDLASRPNEGDPNEVSMVVRSVTGPPRMARSLIGKDIGTILGKIDTAPYSGAVGRLYFAGLALELLALSLASFLKSDGGTTASVLNAPLAPIDRRRMESAAGILRERFREPPCLEEMALEIGVSAAKLKRDFPRRFGVPVHRYLVELRLETADGLLAEGLSVKEAAYRVGYRSASHFAQAYRGRFGIPPAER